MMPVLEVIERNHPMPYPFAVLYRIEGDDESFEAERVATHAEAIAISDRLVEKGDGGNVVTAAWVVDLND